MKIALALFAAASALAASVPAAAAQTGPAGQGLPFDNYQNYLALTQLISLQGIFPSRADTLDQNSAASQTLGMLRSFAGNFATGGGALAQGQILPISQNTALFSVLGTTYGGNGRPSLPCPTCAAARSSAPARGRASATACWANRSGHRRRL